MPHTAYGKERFGSTLSVCQRTPVSPVQEPFSPYQTWCGTRGLSHNTRIALCGYLEQGSNVHPQASCLVWGGTQCPLVPQSPVSVILISKEGLSFPQPYFLWGHWISVLPCWT